MRDYFWDSFAGFVLMLFILLIGIILLVLCGGIAVDYWNGSARASLLEKQTGQKYTWREAAQIKHMYDQNNVKIIFEKEKIKE